jgi:hypothetical protein
MRGLEHVVFVRALGRPIHRWENIKMDLKEIGLEGIDWINLDEGKDKWQAVVNLKFHKIP